MMFFLQIFVNNIHLVAKSISHIHCVIKQNFDTKSISHIHCVIKQNFDTTRDKCVNQMQLVKQGDNIIKFSAHDLSLE